MKRKPIKIDWDELEEAFSNPQAEAGSYLDRVTGRVVLEDEGLDDDDTAFERAGTAAPPMREDPMRLAIRVPDTERKISWMKRFLSQNAEKHEADALAALDAATEAANPARELSQILNENPEVRDAWYLYRSERIQEMIDEWLEEHEIAIVSPPPWRS
jgi:hypothetical protein